jgi:3-methyladenine DNA glycosylase/8-oxoguanine DNA glycosylase
VAAELELTLEAPPLYELVPTVSGQRMGAGDPCLKLSDARAIDWALPTPEGAVAIRVAQRPAGELCVEGWGPGLAWLQPRLPALLGLRDDVSGFDPSEPLRRLWRRHPGLRLPRLPRVFERLVAVVLLQRVTTGEAQQAWRRLVSCHGEAAPGPARLRVPPGPERLRELPSWELVRLGVPHRQAETLCRLARAAPRLEAAAARGAPALATALGEIPGVGPWTTQYVLGSALGAPDAVLVGDDNLPHTIAWVLAGEDRADDARMLELLEPYRGHRFRVIRLVWVSGLRAPRRGPGRRLTGLGADRPGGSPHSRG